MCTITVSLCGCKGKISAIDKSIQEDLQGTKLKRISYLFALVLSRRFRQYSKYTRQLFEVLGENLNGKMNPNLEIFNIDDPFKFLRRPRAVL